MEVPIYVISYLFVFTMGFVGGVYVTKTNASSDKPRSFFDKQKEIERSAARKRSAQKAFSYVSAVDGVVETHQTWKECESRVKGKSGVRFKKAISASEEKEIIESFK